MITMGARSATIEKLYRTPEESELTQVERDRNPGAKHLIGLIHDHYRVQLLPGQRLESLKDKFLHYLKVELQPAQLTGSTFLSHLSKARKMSLLQMCRDIIIRCNTNILFGERLLDIDPGLPETFCNFDDDHWMMLYKMPRLLAGHVYSSQQKVKEDFIKYLTVAKSERAGEAWLVEQMEDGMRTLGIDEEEMATQFFLVYWS